MDKIADTNVFVSDADYIEDHPNIILDTIDTNINLSLTFTPDRLLEKNIKDTVPVEKKISYYHIPLIDGQADFQDFKRAVELLIQKIREDEEILVNCSAGISRSVTVTAVALASLNKGDLNEWIGKVMEEKGNTINPSPELVYLGEKYLEETDNTQNELQEMVVKNHLASSDEPVTAGQLSKITGKTVKEARNVLGRMVEKNKVEVVEKNSSVCKYDLR